MTVRYSRDMQPHEIEELKRRLRENETAARDLARDIQQMRKDFNEALKNRSLVPTYVGRIEDLKPGDVLRLGQLEWKHSTNPGFGGLSLPGQAATLSYHFTTTVVLNDRVEVHLRSFREDEIISLSMAGFLFREAPNGGSGE